MKRLIWLAGGLLIISSCTSNSEIKSESEKDANTLITFNNFEEGDGWGVQNPSLNKERAFSGNYSIKVDKGIEYSYGFSKLLGQVVNYRPKSIVITAHAFVSSQLTGKAALVIAIADPNKNNENLLWKSIELQKVKSYKQWEEVSAEIPLPGNVDESSQLSIYMWRAGATEPVYLDDIKIIAVK